MASMDFLCNPISIAVTALSLIIASLIVALNLQQKRAKKKYPPIGGTIFNQLINFNRLHHYMTDLAGKHKTYRLISPFRNEIYTADPANVEYILKNNFENYGKGGHNYSILRDLLGDGIFTVDGDKWREQRKVSSHEFSTKVLRDFSSVVFRKNVVKLANIVSEAATSNQTMDIQDLFMKSTLDSIFKVAFGVELDSMCGSSEEEAKLKKNIKVIDDFVYKLIRGKTKQMETSIDDSSFKKEDILSRFLQLNETDPKYLRDIILNFIIAGKDTTATTLSWFIYMLCKHPVIQEKFQWMRRYAFRMTLCQMGLIVRKGDMVAYQPYAMGRMRFIWGENAEDFRPERWLDENGIFRQESPFKFTAFQAGPRICLGKEFAYRQMKIFSAVLVGCFVFKMSDEKKAVNYRTMINLHIDGGLHVHASHRLGH
ncbi:hypothetical protein F0562_019134 [Nyssa sinensis]|uniref:Cytochrome P450 n=1 Tax=Nyssa sinensis TaxID=561372 RepID=A0A5J4ZBH5_9ASTE|nr:hypothetical protein F0562_019134 [Nyssa sinensis]